MMYMLSMTRLFVCVRLVCRYGNVTYYTDMDPAHKRNDSAMGGGFENWFSHYMIGVNGQCYHVPSSRIHQCHHTFLSHTVV